MHIDHILPTKSGIRNNNFLLQLRFRLELRSDTNHMEFNVQFCIKSILIGKQYVKPIK